MGTELNSKKHESTHCFQQNLICFLTNFLTNNTKFHNWTETASIHYTPTRMQKGFGSVHEQIAYTSQAQNRFDQLKVVLDRVGHRLN